MKKWNLVLVVPMVLFLSGCQSVSPKTLMQPMPITAEGTYIQHVSGMTFPLAVGDFHRSALFRYDTDGLDISGGYDLFDPPRAIAVTVYVYPAPSVVSIGSPQEVIASARAMMMQREFEARKQEIVSAHPSAKLIQESEVPLNHGDKIYMGKSVTFEFDGILGGRSQPLQSRLYLFGYVGEKWTVAYRFTYPRSWDATKEIEDFLHSLPLTISCS